MLPIVMHTAAQIKPDLDRFGVTTPYLLDDGTISKADDTLGKGMHPRTTRPRVRPDRQGRETGLAWEHPSKWLEPAELLRPGDPEPCRWMAVRASKQSARAR